MSFTEPAYGIQHTIGEGETVTVTFHTGTSLDFTADLTAGDYWTGFHSSPSLLFRVALDIKNEDTTVNGVGTINWLVSTPATGLSHRSAAVRLGLTGDTIDEISFSNPATAQALGWPATASSTDIISNAAPDSTITGVWQSGSLWLPRQPLTYPRSGGIATTATSRTNGGSVVVDGYGRLQKFDHFHQVVHAALVKVSDAAEAGYVSQIDGLLVTDPNAALEVFWRLIVDGSGEISAGRYYPDASDMTTYTEITIDMPGWLAEFMAAGIVDEIAEAPLLYSVRLQGYEGDKYVAGFKT